MIKSTIANLRIGMFRGKKDEDGKIHFCILNINSVI